MCGVFDRRLASNGMQAKIRKKMDKRCGPCACTALPRIKKALKEQLDVETIAVSNLGSLLRLTHHDRGVLSLLRYGNVVTTDQLWHPTGARARTRVEPCANCTFEKLEFLLVARSVEMAPLRIGDSYGSSTEPRPIDMPSLVADSPQRDYKFVHLSAGCA